MNRPHNSDSWLLSAFRPTIQHVPLKLIGRGDDLPAQPPSHSCFIILINHFCIHIDIGTQQLRSPCTWCCILANTFTQTPWGFTIFLTTHRIRFRNSSSSQERGDSGTAPGAGLRIDCPACCVCVTSPLGDVSRATAFFFLHREQTTSTYVRYILTLCKDKREE